MMSLPDFKEKQILFILTDQDKICHLRFRNENIVFEKDEKIINQLSVHKLLAVFIVGDFTLTTVLIRNCEKYGVSLFLLKKNFGLYARLVSAAEGNYILRQKQYQLKPEQELFFAKMIVKNKIINQLALLKKNKMISSADFAVKSEQLSSTVDKATAGSELLGLEGNWTKNFFSEYFKESKWYRRLPKTKADITNYLMDIGYTMLFNFIEAVLGLYGFDVYKGFYHKLFFQRKSLACDLMEPFRCLIDQAIFKAYRLKQVNQKDFKFIAGRYCLPFDKQNKYLKIFSGAVMDNKEDIFKYVRSFYYCLLNGEKEQPFFRIK